MFSLEYLTCVIGIYVCFLTWGILQERVTTTPYTSTMGNPHLFKHFIVLNLCQSITACIVGTLYLKLKRQSIQQIIYNPKIWFKLVQISICNSIASPFGYAALKYIDYPTMILAKSCKLVPVMLVSVLVNKTRYPRYQYVAVLLITMGVSVFMLNHDQHKASTSTTSLYGLGLLATNLLVDGFTNTSQDQVFKAFPKVKGQHMMVLVNMISSLFMALYLLVWSNEAQLARQFFHHTVTPKQVFLDIGLFSIAGGLGQVFIFHTLGTFGSLSLVSITVTRKLISILVSVFLYNHDLTFVQWCAVIVVFTGIGIESLGKYQLKKDNAVEKVTVVGTSSTGSTSQRNKVRKRID